MQKDDFIKLANEGHSRVSVNKVIKNIGASPLDTYKKLERQNSFLFESGSNKGKWSRYSIIGTTSNERIKVTGNLIQYVDGEKIEEFQADDPLNWIENFYNENKVKNLPKDLPFTGGLVGYFGYETIQFIENKIQVNKEDSLGVPDIFLFVCNEIIIFDNEEKVLLKNE